MRKALFPRLALFLWFALGLPVTALSAGVAAAGPADLEHRVSIRMDPTAVEANEDLTWPLTILVHNLGDVGLYSDSLSGTARSLDSLDSGTEIRLSLWGAVRSFRTISAQDSAQFTLNLLPSAEHAMLHFHYFGHRADSTRVEAEFDGEALPGPMSRRLVSEFVTIAGARTEYVHVPPTDSLAPLIVVALDEGRPVRRMFPFARMLSLRGFNVVMAGATAPGASRRASATSPAVAALSAVLDAALKKPGVDAAHVALFGIGRGAASVALLATRRPEVKAVIGASGSYEPISQFARLRTATLVLHAAEDPVAPAEQAHAFYQSLMARNVYAREYTVPGRSHDVSVAAMRNALDFLRWEFKP